VVSPAEEFQLDDPSFARIGRRQIVERFVQVEEVDLVCADSLTCKGQRHVFGAAAALVGDAIPARG
jgi:hypothetical protein